MAEGDFYMTWLTMNNQKLEITTETDPAPNLKSVNLVEAEST